MNITIPWLLYSAWWTVSLLRFGRETVRHLPLSLTLSGVALTLIIELYHPTQPEPLLLITVVILAILFVPSVRLITEDWDTRAHELRTLAAHHPDRVFFYLMFHLVRYLHSLNQRVTKADRYARLYMDKKKERVKKKLYRLRDKQERTSLLTFPEVLLDSLYDAYGFSTKDQLMALLRFRPSFARAMVTDFIHLATVTTYGSADSHGPATAILNFSEARAKVDSVLRPMIAALSDPRIVREAMKTVTMPGTSEAVFRLVHIFTKLCQIEQPRPIVRIIEMIDRIQWGYRNIEEQRIAKAELLRSLIDDARGFPLTVLADLNDWYDSGCHGSPFLARSVVARRNCTSHAATNVREFVRNRWTTTKVNIMTAGFSTCVVESLKLMRDSVASVFIVQTTSHVRDDRLMHTQLDTEGFSVALVHVEAARRLLVDNSIHLIILGFEAVNLAGVMIHPRTDAGRLLETQRQFEKKHTDHVEVIAVGESWKVREFEESALYSSRVSLVRPELITALITDHCCHRRSEANTDIHLHCCRNHWADESRKPYTG